MTVDMALNDRNNTHTYSNGPPPVQQQFQGPINKLPGPPMVQMTTQSSTHLPTQHGPSTFKSIPSDDELFKLGPRELVSRLRKAEAKNSKLSAEQGALVKDINQRMHLYMMEIRGLKEVNLRLQDDNQELRDLCCFLDDDRQKGRKLAREWQRFGRYTASVMRQEVSTYQGKLQELENKQQELIKDNLELKELCLYLDEERATNRSLLCSHCGLPVTQGQRDDGDGSSSSTNNDEAPGVSHCILGLGQYSTARTNSRERLLEDNVHRQRGVINEQVLNYIRGLERRIQQLEGNDKTAGIKSVGHSKPLHPPPYRKPPCPPTEVKNIVADDLGKPEAVVHAMKVLEVHEQLDKPPNGSSSSETDELVDGEKALVREMCNVVWRKLEDGVDRH